MESSPNNNYVAAAVPVEMKKKNDLTYLFAMLSLILTATTAVFAVLYFTAPASEPETCLVENTEESETLGNVYGFDLEKIVGQKEYETEVDGETWALEQVLDTPGNFGISASISPDRKTLELTLNGERLSQAYGVGLTRSYENGLKKITFNQKINDGAFVGFGQAVGDEYIFLIFEDGSVEYIPVLKMLNENKFNSYGKLADVENAVKFYIGNWNGMFAFVQTENGNIYDLAAILNLY